MNTARVKDLTTGTPVKLIISFALPLMAGNVFQQLYTMVDTAVVGRGVGINALSALGAADWLTWFIIGLIQGFTQGFSILMSQYFGAKDYKQLNRTIGLSAILSGIIALICVVCGQIFARPILIAINTPADIIEPALLYVRIIFASAPVIMLYNLLSSILRSLGDSKTPLYAMVAASITNIGLDLLFVMVFHWGIAGAAVATIIAQVVSVLYCFLKVRKISIISLTKSDFSINKGLLSGLLKLGTPIALQNAIIAIGGIVVQSVINGYGVIFIAGFVATNKLYGLLEIAATSFGYAVTTYVGQNLGAGLISRIKKGMKSAAIVALFTSIAIGAGMIAFGKPILSIFISGSPEETTAALDIAYNYLFIMSVFLPILYMLHIYRSGLMGLGNTIIPMLSGFSEMVFRMGSVLILPIFIGQTGVFFAEISAWFIAAIILVISYYIYIRRFKNEIA